MLWKSLRPIALLTLVCVTFLANRSLIRSIKKSLAQRPRPLSRFTFVEEDVPERLHVANARPHVLMRTEESAHYNITSPNAYLEWLYTATPADQGNVHLGTSHRVFNINMFHQLHCLRAMRTALAEEDELSAASTHHMEHCLAILKDHTLCAADASLEPGEPFSRNFATEREWGEMRCLDVEAYYATMRAHWTEWLTVVRASDIGPVPWAGPVRD
ncbi:uncharacterized protein BXZ73DRAFT_46073 [Epithele typhae]|uniref:uncharacterized protein n=1 Tax=Epithele typhae TaxID=378194 RepID=UPI0020075092|nr:uncharacterized protein BXZ73DRAFT_46073 [Epithele typhae]KAH9934036.1 hypothetical protein BXZ73DRAFT_46073 [Epithele typhae]